MISVRMPSQVRSVQIKPRKQNVSGYSIFESDTEDDRRGSRQREGRSVFSCDSDDSDAAHYRRSRSRPRGYRAW